MSFVKKVAFVKRRKALKLTQKQVADAVGVTSRTVQSWELGENIPRLDPLQVWRLCQILQCTAEDLARDFFPEAFAGHEAKAAESPSTYVNGGTA
jgi:transcriptional regulator with XRE-family HTH domain